MLDPTPSRRFALVLVLLIPLAVSNCVRPKVRKTMCDRGNASPSRPFICVDDRTLATSPASAYVYDYEADANNKPTARPVTVHWLAREGGNLGVEFTDKSCTNPVKCDGKGHCWTTVKPLAEGEKNKKCSYTLNLDGRASDPELIVNPCCWLIDEVTVPLGTVDRPFNE